MLSRLLHSFRAAAPAPVPEPDAELALGALLVRVAMSDHDYQYEEISRIDRILAHLFDLNPIQAAKMRATCEKLHAAAPETEEFAALIRDEMGHEDRMSALAALWQVVMADGEQQDAELRILNQTRMALGLSEGDSTTARDQALSE